MSVQEHYTLPFACFACRKSFKSKLRLYRGGDIIVPPCPQCKRDLHFVGRYFKAPLHRNIKQWRKVEVLYNQGWRASGYDEAPRTLREAYCYSVKKNLWLEHQRREIQKQEQLEKWRKMRKWPHIRL